MRTELDTILVAGSMKQCCLCSYSLDIESLGAGKQVVYIYITPGNKCDIMQMIAGKKLKKLLHICLQVVTPITNDNKSIIIQTIETYAYR